MRMKRSISALAWGDRCVIFLFLNPVIAAYVLKSWLLNGGPLFV